MGRFRPISFRVFLEEKYVHAPRARLALVAACGGNEDNRLDAATKQLQSAAAPLLQPLSPEVRDSIQRIGRSAE